MEPKSLNWFEAPVWPWHNWRLRQINSAVTLSWTDKVTTQHGLPAKLVWPTANYMTYNMETVKVQQGGDYEASGCYIYSRTLNL